MGILPGSYMEWGICFFTCWFCLWKYGRNMDVIKGMRQIFKKIEDVLLADETKNVNREKKMESSEIKYYKRIPTTGTPFSPRSNKSAMNKCNNSNRTHSFGTIMDNFIMDELRRSEPEQGSSCFVCEAPTKARIIEEIKESKPLSNCLSFESTRNPSNPWYVRLFYQFAFWWRKWYIGVQFNVPTVKEIMGDDKVHWAITEASLQEFREREREVPLELIVEKYEKRVERTVRGMRAKQPAHPWYSIHCRIAPWIIAKFLSRIYPQIHVRDSQIDLVRKARASGHPILYLPVHKSHLDYILISWSLVNCDIRAPMVAAGDNLNIPIFSLLMRSVAGFFIKRKFDSKSGKRDVVYRTMIQTYMRRCLTNDNDMEFFVEGGRTRTGKPCLPKGGLLNIVLDTILTQKVEDILVIPVNFSYDKIIEGNYIREQLGQPKLNESFASALMALISSLQPRYGNARVDYGHPFSMKEFVMRYSDVPMTLSDEVSSSGCSSQSDSESVTGKTAKDFGDVSHGAQRTLVEALGRHATYEGFKCYTMTATNALAFLLLNKFRNGTTLDILKNEIEELKGSLNELGHDCSFTDVDAAIDHGVKILGPTLIRIETRENEKWIAPVTDLPNVIELSYYSNCVLPVYAMEAVIATSVFKLLGDFCNNNFETHEKLKESEMIMTCLEYIDVLSNEFLFCPPCQTIVSGIKDSITSLVKQGLFSVALNENQENVLDIPSSKALSRLVYLKNMLRPILDVYITSSQVLRRLVDHEADEKKLQMNILAEIKKQLLNNVLLYGESLALDPIRNFIQRALQWEVLECHRKDAKTIYFLSENFNSSEAVGEVVQRLAKLKV